jgi:hypothetical protein
MLRAVTPQLEVETKAMPLEQSTDVKFEIGHRQERRCSTLRFFDALSFRLSAGKLRLSARASGISMRIEMAAEVKKEIELEIARIPFPDVVRYCKLSVNAE